MNAFRIAVAVGIVAVTGFFGYLRGREYKARRAEVESLRTALRRLQADMLTRGVVLCDALASGKSYARGASGDALVSGKAYAEGSAGDADFAESWFAHVARKIRTELSHEPSEAFREAAEACGTHLREAELARLCALLGTLGDGPREEVAQTFDALSAYAQELYETAVADEKKYSGLYLKLGLLAGLAIDCIFL